MTDPRERSTGKVGGRNDPPKAPRGDMVVLLAAFLSEEVPFPRWHLFFLYRFFECFFDGPDSRWISGPAGQFPIFLSRAATSATPSLGRSPFAPEMGGDPCARKSTLKANAKVDSLLDSSCREGRLDD